MSPVVVKGESRTCATAISWGSTGAGLWFEAVEGAETMAVAGRFCFRVLTQSAGDAVTLCLEEVVLLIGLDNPGKNFSNSS